MHLRSFSKVFVEVFPGPLKSSRALPVYFPHGRDLAMFIEDPSHAFDAKLEHVLLRTSLSSDYLFCVALLLA